MPNTPTVDSGVSAPIPIPGSKPVPGTFSRSTSDLDDSWFGVGASTPPSSYGSPPKSRSQQSSSDTSPTPAPQKAESPPLLTLEKPPFRLATANGKNALSSESQKLLERQQGVLIFIASTGGNAVTDTLNPPVYYTPELAEQYIKFGQRQRYNILFGDASEPQENNLLRQLLFVHPYELRRALKNLDIAVSATQKLGMPSPETVASQSEQGSPPSQKSKKPNIPPQGNIMWEKFIKTHFMQYFSSQGNENTPFTPVSDQVLSKAIEMLTQLGIDEDTAYTYIAMPQEEYTPEFHKNRTHIWNSAEKDAVISIAKKALNWQVIYTAALCCTMKEYTKAISHAYMRKSPFLGHIPSAFGDAGNWEALRATPEYDEAKKLLRKTLAENPTARQAFDNHVKAAVENYKGTRAYRKTINQPQTTRQQYIPSDQITKYDLMCQYLTSKFVEDENCATLAIALLQKRQKKTACFVYPQAWQNENHTFSIYTIMQIIDPSGKLAHFFVIEKMRAPEPVNKSATASTPEQPIFIIPNSQLQAQQPFLAAFPEEFARSNFGFMAHSSVTLPNPNGSGVLRIIPIVVFSDAVNSRPAINTQSPIKGFSAPAATHLPPSPTAEHAYSPRRAAST